MKIVHTDNAPPAIGPYAQATVHGGIVYCSGQIPMDPSGTLTGGDVQAQTRQALTNLSHVLEAAGASLSSVLKCTVFLQSMDDFAAMNEVYAEMFGDHTPARAAVQVAKLPKGVDVEIDAIAVVS